MAALIILALALFTGHAYSSPASRIAGGVPATVEDFPSIVQVEFLGASTGIWSQSCAGSILTARYIVSAANCFHGIFYDRSNRRVRAGTTQRNDGGFVDYIELEFNHPSFGANGMDGDVTLVKLLSGFVYSDVIKQGTIIDQDYILPNYLPVTLAGWGATENGGLESDELQKAEVYIIDRESCTEFYENQPIPSVVTENMICTTVGKGSCQGDLGGPLYYQNLLVGIQSWGESCANETAPAVSTSVASYTYWIAGNAV